MRGRELADYLNGRDIAGVRFWAARFKPESGALAGHVVEGVRIEVTQRDLVSSARLGLEIASALQKLYPGRIDFAASRKLIGNKRVLRGLASGEDPRLILEGVQEGLRRFAATRRQYLLY